MFRAGAWRWKSFGRAATRGIFAAALTGVGTLACLACGSGGKGSAATPDAVILVVLDTVRGDRLGCTGFTEARTPHLDSLASAGVLFTDAMTTAPVTLPAVASLLTGRWPFHHGVRDNDRFVLAGSEETLADRLKAAGWRTGAVLGSAVLDESRGLARGFERWDDDFQPPFPVYDPTLRPVAADLATKERRADRVTDLAIERLRSFGSDRGFLLVHYFDAHMFYDPPSGFRALHPRRPYDAEISFLDAELGRLLAEVRRTRPNALVVVVSDHGESNMEHGEPQHGFLVYQSTLRIVAIAAGAGVPRGVVRPDAVSLVDVEPTIARAVGLPAARVPRDGRALAWGKPDRRPPTMYAETLRPLLSYGWSELRALRSGSWKWIGGAGRSELYDLATDPGEAHPVDEPERAAMFVDRLGAMIGPDDAEAVWREALGRPDPDRLEAITSLGYVRGSAAAAAPPLRRHPLDELPRWLDTQRSKSLIKLAFLRITEERHGEAATLLDQALALDQGFADAWYLRGHVRAGIGDRKGALADLQVALERDPDHTGARNELARLRSEPVEAPERNDPPVMPGGMAGTVAGAGLGAVEPVRGQR
jgi:choline-sulfatase